MGFETDIRSTLVYIVNSNAFIFTTSLFGLRRKLRHFKRESFFIIISKCQ